MPDDRKLKSFKRETWSCKSIVVLSLLTWSYIGFIIHIERSCWIQKFIKRFICIYIYIEKCIYIILLKSVFLWQPNLWCQPNLWFNPSRPNDKWVTISCKVINVKSATVFRHLCQLALGSYCIKQREVWYEHDLYEMNMSILYNQVACIE